MYNRVLYILELNSSELSSHHIPENSRIYFKYMNNYCPLAKYFSTIASAEVIHPSKLECVNASPPASSKGVFSSSIEPGFSG